MMSAQPTIRSTPQSYFQQDAESEHKLEFFDGHIVAQAGSTARHNLIVANLIGHLYPQARARGCRVYPSDMRVQAIDQRAYTYPDLTVVCGEPQYADPNEMTLLNPTVIIEILSPSTEARDRTDKFLYYRQIASLEEYVLIAQHAPYVQRYTRQTAHFWYVHLTEDMESDISLDAVGCTLAMREIYEGISF